MSSQTDLAVSFLEACAHGNAVEAFGTYLTDGFVHHNVHFPADPVELAKGMDESDREHPDKDFEVQRTVEQGDLVITHSRVAYAGMEISAVHIMRFEGDKIAEFWDVAAPTPDDSPNTNGPF